MATFFDPTPEQKRDLEKIAAGIPGVQQTLTSNHPQLSMPDRGAHQQQLAGSKVLLTVAGQLPAALDGLSIFQRSRRRRSASGGCLPGSGARMRRPILTSWG